MTKKGNISFTKLYIGIAILLFVIAFGWKVMQDQQDLMPELNVNYYNGTTAVNLSLFDDTKTNLIDNVNKLESANVNESALTGVIYIDLPIKYISTVVQLFAKAPAIINDIIKLIPLIIPVNLTLLKSLLMMMSGLVIVILVVRVWKNMDEP